MTILPISYLPSVEWMAHLAQEPCMVDLGEHYIKRSERNRAQILTPTGVMDLTVPLVHANRPRTPIQEMRIDYSKRWQHQHAVALKSAYKASPYFDFYWEALAPFFEERWEGLVEFDRALLDTLLRLLGMEDRRPRFSESYIEPSSELCDLRPKKRTGSTFVAEPYVQVFSDRLPFEANLSVVDLLFAEGPAARALLMRCHI
uniref:WbqC family protein n=1 Tax=Alistipes sp. TaxID=1872444 RepID=UPI004055FBCC